MSMVCQYFVQNYISKPKKKQTKLSPLDFLLGPSSDAATMMKSNMFQLTFQKPKKSWYHLMRISMMNTVRKNLSSAMNTLP